MDIKKAVWITLENAYVSKGCMHEKIYCVETLSIGCRRTCYLLAFPMIQVSSSESTLQ